MKKLVEAQASYPDRWLTEKQVASLTGLSVHTLRRHRQRRCGIPYAKLGRSVRYSEVAVLTHMASRQVTFLP